MLRTLTGNTIIRIQDAFADKKMFQIIHGLISYVRDEIKTGKTVKINPLNRLNIYMNGFLSKNYYLYNLAENDKKFYLSDFTQKAYTTVNKRVDITRDKKLFHNIMNEHGLHGVVPKLYGEIYDDIWDIYEYTSFEKLLRERKKLVIKPRYGAKGREVYVCELIGNEIIVNGSKKELASFKKIVSGKMGRINYRGNIIEEYIPQADFLSKIYSKSSNTVRIVVINPPYSNPICPMAILRIGTDRSEGMDNFSKGGLSVQIDMNTGELGMAGEVLDNRKLIWHKVHPDTGSQIYGVVIPGWNQILKKLILIMKGLVEFEYVGVDLLITEKGDFKIIEMNCNTDIDLLQIHRPLLKDNRLVDFFKHHDIPI